MNKVDHPLDQRPENTTLLEDGTLVYHHGRELEDNHIEWCQFPEETCSCPTE